MSSEQRLHPYTILFAFLTQIRIFLLPGIFLMLGIGSWGSEWGPRGGDWWQPWMMIFIVPAAAAAVVRYLTYRYRYEENELVIRSGLLFRKERHIPYARIQNIDAEQNILHRLLNVIEIKIETGGGRSAEATMSVLPLEALAEMRRRVFAEREAPVAGGAGLASDAAGEGDPLARSATALPHDAPAAAPPLLQLGLKDLLLCGFIENRGAVLIGAGFGVLWEAGIVDRMLAPMFGQETIGRGVIRDVVRGAFGSATDLLWNRIGMIVVIVIGLLLLIRLFSMLWALTRLYGFTLALVNGDARTHFGLLTRVAMTIPLRRVQTLTVRESPLHRLFTRVAVRVDTAGGRADEQNQQSEREYLAPILHAQALDDFARAIVGLGVAGVQWRAPHPRAFRREVKGWLFNAAMFCGLASLLLGWYALALAPFALAWAIVGARQTIKHLGWVATDEALLFKSGWLWRRLVVVRFAKVQVVLRHQSPFDRWNGMARVHVDTAGASAGGIHIPYIDRAEAEALHDRLAKEAAARQFMW